MDLSFKISEDKEVRDQEGSIVYFCFSAMFLNISP